MIIALELQVKNPAQLALRHFHSISLVSDVRKSRG
jgi:hypothetical protein